MQLSLSNNMPKYMREFIEFCVESLDLDRLRGEIEVSLSRGALDEESYGLCWGDRREVEIHIASKQWGKPLDQKSKLMSIAHELAHAKQYLTGEMKCKNDQYTVWKGRKYKYDPETEKNRPWEKEAVRVENKIYEEWVENRSSKKYK